MDKKKLKASIEIKNNEYYLIIEDEKDEKQSVRMNISDLKQPMNKCNLLIPSPPYNEPRDIQNIHCLPYKAKAKIENNQKDVEELQNKFRGLKYSDKQKQKYKNYSSSSEVEQSPSEDEFSGFQIPVLFQLSHLEIRESQQGKQNQPAEAYDKSNLRSNLIDFLRTKGDNGANIQEIKQYYKFQSVPEKHLRDSLKLFAKTTMRANKLIYILPSTLQN
ncbi:unnamed protein product (macronuclear) [Paramecium tetraurelia]|uniref:TFIIF beta subunit HTH domain-containing protein n=1 Tax=Paramecium tetraurelia TaxID=5888 RepID=A0CNC5_PARTE|nr:uncharacterized protein GSPATT00008734001 [Paramecium tetraurelia]CAK72292.1 unnamed protein product [Paramecium tetraurelia]|eukprot:XP_001439689.1 hypothetical protein (macronuclear) [Paramecium tetraurelia strain d4-2]